LCLLLAVHVGVLEDEKTTENKVNQNKTKQNKEKQCAEQTTEKHLYYFKE